MLFISPLRRAVAVFFLLLFLAVVASAVCVAFGAHTMPSQPPGAGVAGSPPDASLHSKPTPAMQAAVPASRARVGT